MELEYTEVSCFGELALPSYCRSGGPRLGKLPQSQWDQGTTVWKGKRDKKRAWGLKDELKNNEENLKETDLWVKPPGTGMFFEVEGSF